MSDLEHPSFNDQINDEAAHWFIELRGGELDEAGRRAFDAWVRASPEHLRAFLQLTALWSHSASLDLHERFPTEALIASAREVTNVIPLTRGRVVARPRRGRRIGLAAAVCAGLVAGALVTWFVSLERQTYSTEVGEQRTLRLPDGSTVTLNSRSRARIGFDELTRTVDLLEGEALFRAAPETTRPFIVRADGTSVRALGTEFDIDKRNRGAVVTVLQGRVAVSSAQTPTDRGANTTPDNRYGATVISAGEQLDATAGLTSTPTRTNVSSAIAWLQGRVMLQSAPLEEVAERFNRYSPRRLVTEEHGSVPFRLSGVFSTDPDFLIRYLRERTDIQVEESPTQIRIIHTGAR
jgi:transmembrane sensor